MAGKAPVFCGRALYYTLDEVTKNQWIDFAVDMARAELGEDATDDQIVAYLQPKLDVVWRQRYDKSVELAGRYQRCVKASERYEADARKREEYNRTQAAK